MKHIYLIFGLITMVSLVTAQDINTEKTALILIDIQNFKNELI